uniref:Reverse transcriptase domain-containing protein n=1 Tax=Angiostrongylus cantonensis TaxID=6313 RepID=A0A0K0DQZ6_ANGCA
MPTLGWDNVGVKIVIRQSHHLPLADDIVFITPGISQAERMLTDFDNAHGKIGLRLNLMKTMFMKNGLYSFAPNTFNATNISEYSSYVYLGREVNMSGSWSLRKQHERALSVIERTVERAMLGVSRFT